jgi:predicted permease
MWGTLFGLTGPAFVACMVSAAVPTATSAYVLARQLGGDAPLVATTLTVQTAISFLTIPLFIWLAQTMW